MGPLKNMNKRTTLKVLKFALEHDLEFCVHEVNELLHSIDVQEICNELNIGASIEARFPDSKTKGAYYLLKFYKENNDDTKRIGMYVGRELVSPDNNRLFSPEKSKDIDKYNEYVCAGHDTEEEAQ